MSGKIHAGRLGAPTPESPTMPTGVNLMASTKRRARALVVAGMVVSLAAGATAMATLGGVASASMPRTAPAKEATSAGVTVPPGTKYPPRSCGAETTKKTTTFTVAVRMCLEPRVDSSNVVQLVVQPEIRAISGKPDFCHLFVETPAAPGAQYPMRTDASNYFCSLDVTTGQVWKPDYEFWVYPPSASYTWTAQATLLAGPKNGTLNTLVASHTASFAPLP
jgi:hypothetical protein